MPLSEHEWEYVKGLSASRLPRAVLQMLQRLDKESRPNNEELKHARSKADQAGQQIKAMKEKVEFMVEVFQCAAKGGSEIAKAAVERLAADYLTDTDIEARCRGMKCDLCDGPHPDGCCSPRDDSPNPKWNRED